MASVAITRNRRFIRPMSVRQNLLGISHLPGISTQLFQLTWILFGIPQIFLALRIYSFPVLIRANFRSLSRFYSDVLPHSPLQTRRLRLGQRMTSLIIPSLPVSLELSMPLFKSHLFKFCLLKSHLLPRTEEELRHNCYSEPLIASLISSLTKRHQQP